MIAIRKWPKGYLCIFKVKFNLGYIIVQGGAHFWLVLLIPIELVTLVNKSLLQVMSLFLALDLSLWLVRSNLPLSFFSRRKVFFQCLDSKSSILLNCSKKRLNLTCALLKWRYLNFHISRVT